MILTDAKTDVDVEECNKPANAGNRDQKNEEKVPFQQNKINWKRWKKSDEKTLKISGQKRPNKLKGNEEKDDARPENVKRN